MAAAAHDPAFAAKMGIKMKVAKEFNMADKGMTVAKKKPWDATKAGYHKL